MTIAHNRRGSYDYTIEDTVEAGIALAGSEVKSLRLGKININQSYASVEGGQVFLVNAHIEVYEPAGRFGHEPRRKRRLLLHRREIRRFMGAVQRGGKTLIPLSVYFDKRGFVKVKLGLGVGRRRHDKRQRIKEREWGRQRGRLLKAKTRL